MQKNSDKINSDKENKNIKKAKSTLNNCKTKFNKDLNNKTGIQSITPNLVAPKQKQ